MPKLRNGSEIRWYLYRSASKLDMLYNQLVATSGPFSGSLSVEVPGLKASIGTSPSEPPSDEEKLDLIEANLRSRDLVGTVENPRDYVAGELRMRWGLYNDQGARPQEEPPLVFFGGIHRSEEIVVGLGGSSKHVLGHDGATSTYSRSSTYALVHWLLAGLNDLPQLAYWPDSAAEKHEVLASVTIALHYLRPPTQRLRFLAKTLLSGTVHGHEHFTGFKKARVLLGTPLYVLMSEPPQDEDRWGLDEQW